MLIRLPLIALILPIFPNAQARDLVRLFEKLRRQTQADMPRDVAMHEPRTGIVSNERNYQVSSGGEHGDISPWRILVIQSLAVVEDADAGAHDVKIVAVQVDWVGLGRWKCGYRLNHPVGPSVGFGEGDEIHCGWIGIVTSQDVFEGGFVPFDGHGVEVEVPLEEGLAGLVFDEGEPDVEDGGLRDSVVAGDVEFDVGDEVGVGVIAVEGWGQIGASRIRWELGRVGAGVGEDGEGVGIQIVTAAGLTDNVEPVVPDRLVGIDDYVVALADGEE